MSDAKERRQRRTKSKSTAVVEEAPPPPPPVQQLEVPQGAARYFAREKSPFEVGANREMQVASSHAIIDKASVMDITGGTDIANKVDEYISMLFTDYCALDKASCADISEVKIVVIEEEEEPEPQVIVCVRKSV